ncbi:MAG: electron transfer flavoprotein subunit alpha/FixB family protein, partial [Bryobacteraceae bacterium]
MSVLAILEPSHRMSAETLVAAQQLGAELGVPVSAAVLGSGLDAAVAALSDKKLDRLYVVEHEGLAAYTADGFTAAAADLIRRTGPSLALFPHTYQVRDFAPKLATRFERVLVSDVVRVRAEAGALIFVRQLFQGKLNGDYRVSGPAPHFASIQAGAYRADQAESGTAVIEKIAPEIGEIRVRAEAPFRESARAVDLTAAEIIVSVGRGIKEKENIALVEELAKALGAELAASRPICDNGWLPMERQVGSSGQTVAPKLYLAVGISGAIQHLVGMKGSKTVVAINRDANAPIFEIADYGIVGDLFEV